MMKTLQENISALEYENARNQLGTGSFEKEVLARLEIGFFYNECGRFSEALEVIHGIPALADKWPNTPEDFKNALIQFNPEYYQLLNLRYFPEMVTVQGGTFLFGPFRGKQQVMITLSDFNISTTPVTVWQYAVYCYPSNPSMLEKMPIQGFVGNYPMVNLNWYEAVEYANWLSFHQGLQPVYKIDKKWPDPNNQNKSDKVHWSVQIIPDANGYRLPMEAEWEYAAGGGNQRTGFQYAGSNQIEKVAWYSSNTKGIQAVAQKQPNELGIYDMSGLVWEWCWDWEGPYQPGHWKNPQGHLHGTWRIMRGGSFRDVDDQNTVINRGNGNPHFGDNSFGMRLVRSI